MSAAQEKLFGSEITENNICIYTYDDGKPIAVTFILGDDGTVSANGIIILNDDLCTIPWKRLKKLLLTSSRSDAD